MELTHLTLRDPLKLFVAQFVGDPVGGNPRQWRINFAPPEASAVMVLCNRNGPVVMSADEEYVIEGDVITFADGSAPPVTESILVLMVRLK